MTLSDSLTVLPRVHICTGKSVIKIKGCFRTDHPDMETSLVESLLDHRITQLRMIVDDLDDLVLRNLPGRIFAAEKASEA